jgi:hypothetical protein
VQSASFGLAGAELCKTSTTAVAFRTRSRTPELVHSWPRFQLSKFSPLGNASNRPFCDGVLCLRLASPHPQSSALAAAFCAHARPCLPPWATAHRNLTSSAIPAGSMPAAPSAAGARSRLAPVRESPGTCASTRASLTASASASSATSHAGGPRPRSPASSRCSPSRSGKLQIFKVITAVIKGGPPLRRMSYARFSGNGGTRVRDEKLRMFEGLVGRHTARW